MASPVLSSLPVSPSREAPTAIMRGFVRACGHRQRLIHTLGDSAQAARYEATACTACREPVITFRHGWGYGGRR